MYLLVISFNSIIKSLQKRGLLFVYIRMTVFLTLMKRRLEKLLKLVSLMKFNADFY